MSRRSAWVAAAIALIVCLPIRLYQIFSLSDHGTGFYTDKGLTTGILTAVLVLGVVLAALMSYLDRSAPKAYSSLHSIPTAVFGIMTGLGLVAQSFVSFAADVNLNRIMYMILALFGILTGVVLMLTAYDFAAQQNHLEHHPLLALIPPLWGCVCLITLFITYVSLVNIVDNILNTFTAIFLLLFLFYQAKILSGVDREKSGRMIYVFGLPAVILTLLTGIADTAALFAEPQEGVFPAGLHIVTIVFALYIISFLVAYRRLPDAQEPQAGEEPVKSEAEEPEQPAMLSEWKDCFEFLAKEYHSEVKFTERAISPFQSGKI